MWCCLNQALHLLHSLFSVLPPSSSLPCLPLFSDHSSTAERHASHFDHRTRGGEREGRRGREREREHIETEYNSAGHQGWYWRIWHLFYSWWNGRSASYWWAYRETKREWESEQRGEWVNKEQGHQAPLMNCVRKRAISDDEVEAGYATATKKSLWCMHVA